MLWRTGFPFWLQGGLPEEGIDLFHAGSLELGSRVHSEFQKQVDCTELWRVISEKGEGEKKKKSPMWPHYWRFVPTVIRNQKRHHSSQKYGGEDERQEGCGVGTGWSANRIIKLTWRHGEHVQILGMLNAGTTPTIETTILLQLLKHSGHKPKHPMMWAIQFHLMYFVGN